MLYSGSRFNQIMTDDEVRSAGQRAPERQAQGMSTAELVEKTRATRELGSTYRVYCKGWVFDSRHDSKPAAQAHYLHTYEGRLADGDSTIERDFDGTWTLQLNLWTVAAEWKRSHLADQFAAALVEDGRATTDTVQVVARNSRQEHVLRQYSVLKLPAATASP